MLFSSFENTMDEKGRLIIPAKFRDDFRGKCVLTDGLDGCVYAYTREGWEQFVKAMDELPEEDEKVRRLLRHYYGSAEECDIDKQGRMTMPQSIRDRAGLGRELVTVGMSKRVEIWNRAAFLNNQLDKEQVAEYSDHASKLRNEMKGGGASR
jgi:MraZ protein